MTRSRQAVIGVFLVGGVLLFAAGLFLIGSRRLLFVDQFELNAQFGRVTGLQVGSPVRVAGLDAGEVTEITIPPSPSERFAVSMRVREDVRQLIRTDSVAGIQTDGIVGNTFIQVSIGSEDAPIVPPGGTIRGRDPIEFADLIEEGRETFRTITREVMTLKDDLSETVVALTGLVHTADEVVTDTGAQIERLTTVSTGAVEDFRVVLDDVQHVVEGVRSGRGTVGKLLTDDALYTRMTNVTAEIESTMENVRAAAEEGRDLVASLSGPQGAAQQVARTLRETLLMAQEVVGDLAEGTEALKHNFLFRGFFRDRGFFDLDAISREAYLEGALEDGRTPLRVWIEADLLFERAPDGTERLSEEGRQRIDAAMGDLLRYPRNSPLVIEGYAAQDPGQGVYLASADRAELVRDYIVERFRRRPTLVEALPMGSFAPHAPSDDGTWSGVALALWVSNEALAEAAQNP